MKVTLRQPDIDPNNGDIVLRECLEYNNISVPCEAIIAIDGSTSNTGLAILKKNDGGLIYTASLAREYKNDETPVQYKVRLKRFIDNILKINPLITHIYYEEPFIGYAEASKNLMMLRTSVEELIIENEPNYNYIQHSEINNMKWKRMFLAPDKCPQGTEAQKDAVRCKLEKFMPYLSIVTQDEIDAIAMGFVATVQLRNGNDEELKSKKKIKPFKYEIQFFGGDCDDIVLEELLEYYKGPKSILQNGILLTEISSTTNFDKHIYEKMGSDDKIVIVKFSSNSHCNLVLQYKIGALAYEFDYIYAVVWRKSRKG